MSTSITDYHEGDRVVVTQQISQRDEVWTTRISGQVIRCEQAKTGSWFAHSKEDKLWLDRIILRADDGEIIVCALDANTRIDIQSASNSSGLHN